MPVTSCSPCSLRLFQACPAVLDFEALFDGRFHVVVAATFVLDRDTVGIEFPGGNDVIASPAIVVGIFSSYGTTRLLPHGLCPGRVTLDEYLVRALGGSEMRCSRERKNAGNEISHENRS